MVVIALVDKRENQNQAKKESKEEKKDSHTFTRLHPKNKAFTEKRKNKSVIRKVDKQGRGSKKGH